MSLIQVTMHRCCCFCSTVILLTSRLHSRVNKLTPLYRASTRHRPLARHCTALSLWRDHSRCQPLDFPTPGLLSCIRLYCCGIVQLF